MSTGPTLDSGIPRRSDDDTTVEGEMENDDSGDVVDAATLRGQPVVSASGDELAQIESLMLDTTSGRIAYAVLSLGGFAGFGNKLFAVPWSALTVDTEHKRVVLDETRERLESAPGFDRSSWPSMRDRDWANEIHTYYEASPYWDDPLSASSG